MSVFQDLTGMKFGKLTVIELAGMNKHKQSRWRARCSCGKMHIASGYHLTQGRIKSCGCLHGEKHGLVGTPEYIAWQRMLDRCRNENYCYYHRYGGRGISVCDRWASSFTNFLVDMGKRPSSRHTLERIDNDDGYHPDNCVWASRKKQMRNMSRNRVLTYKGRSMCLCEWEEYTGIRQKTIASRIDRYGWTVEKALTTPVRGG